ncbi:MAG: SCO family protein [Actinomycetes bacterium]
MTGRSAGKPDPSRRTTARRLALAAALAAAALAVSGCAGGSAADAPGSPVAVGKSASSLHGTAIQHPYPLPDLQFTDTSGRRYVPAKDAAAPVTLVFFGYTHCPDVCNVVLANVAAALRRSDKEVRANTQLVFVTTDPQRDTDRVVRDYLDRFDPGYVGLRAPLATMKAAAAALHISYDGTTPVAGGGYEVTHGTQVTAFRDGRAAVVWSAETPVADLRADLAALAQ